MMPIIHSDKGQARKYSDEDIAAMERMTETMSHREIGRRYGVSKRVIARQLEENGTPRDTVYRPRILAQWPRGIDFENDNLTVID